MDKIEIYNLRNDIIDALNDSHLIEAMQLVKQLVNEAQQWELRNELEQLGTTYKLLLQYLRQGASDPERYSIQERVRQSLYSLTDRCVIALRQDSGSEVLYARRRELNDITLSSIIADYRQATNRHALLTSVPDEQRNEQAIDATLQQCELLETKQFNKVWSTMPMTAGEAQELTILLNDNDTPGHLKGLLVSALFVGSIMFYDETKLCLLLQLYLSQTDNQVKLRALTASTLIMNLHEQRVAHAQAVELLAKSIIDMPQAQSDMGIVQLELARSRNTANITRQMKEEIIPDIMRMRPGFKGGERPTGKVEFVDLEANPEWQEWLEKSGIARKMEEFSEMQMDGGDVFIATFGNLKSFPFFKTMSNWFLPFHAGHSDVQRYVGNLYSAFSPMLGAKSFLCDSDKYSLCISMGSMPPEQRNAMSQQVDAHSEEINEMHDTSLPDETRSKARIVNCYVQDLYRFFNLFSRRREFPALFDSAMDFTELPHLTSLTNATTTLTLVAELYFKNKFYHDALHYYSLLLEKHDCTDVQVYQKMGFAHQNLGHLDEALEYYHRYELVDENDVWTLRHIATCYRESGQLDDALQYYRKIEELQPDKLRNVLQVGHCLLDMGRSADAMQQYLKADFMDDNSHRSWRPIAWCAFLQGNYGRSIDYYNKIEQHDTPSGIDLMNHGHALLCSGNTSQAIDCYRKALQAMEGDSRVFISNFENDIEPLINHGINRADLPLIIDAVVMQEQ